MNTAASQKGLPNKKISILKVLTAISFLLIIDPLVDPGIYSKPLTFLDYLTGVQVATALKDVIFLKGQPYGWWDALLIAYCLALIYLLFVPYSRKLQTIVCVFIALFALFIPALLFTTIALSTGFIKYLPSLVTIVLFWGLAIVLLRLLLKQLIIIKQQSKKNKTLI